MFRWLTGRGASASQINDMQARISSLLWRQVIHAHPFCAYLSGTEQHSLQRRAAWLLASKQINGARGLALDDFMRLSIAVQAALPILNLSPTLYEGWEEIIVYPHGFSIAQSIQDEDGVVHEYIDEIAGQTWYDGPVVLSWHDTTDTEGAFNVVIHEFAHKLDLQRSRADGMPDLTQHKELYPHQWHQVLSDSLAQFRFALHTVQASIPLDVDPTIPAADHWYETLPLDPYAAHDEAEFFAVSSEHFFTDPQPLAHALPNWYELLRSYYRQDPLARLP